MGSSPPGVAPSERETETTIRQIELELEKAEHGMALPYDAERVGQLRSMLREETIGRAGGARRGAALPDRDRSTATADGKSLAVSRTWTRLALEAEQTLKESRPPLQLIAPNSASRGLTPRNSEFA
jgi:hypothetical protein